MFQPEQIDPQLVQAQQSYANEYALLEAARVRQAEARNNKVRGFFAGVAVKYRERTAYDSEEHLAMVEQIRALERGEPIEY